MKDYLKNILKAAGAAVTIGGLTALLVLTGPSKNDLIKYLGYQKGKHRVAVLSGQNIIRLEFNEKGEKTDEIIYRWDNYLIYSDLNKAPSLEEVTREASKDFPIGVEFHRMLSAAKEYQ